MESESTTSLYDKDTLAALKEQVLSGLPAYGNLINGEDERSTSALETLGTLTKGGNEHGGEIRVGAGNGLVDKLGTVGDYAI